MRLAPWLLCLPCPPQTVGSFQLPCVTQCSFQWRLGGGSYAAFVEIDHQVEMEHIMGALTAEERGTVMARNSSIHKFVLL